jgi:hypothetical protein
MKIKKNHVEVKHVEASLSFLVRDVVEGFQLFSPPVHEVEATRLSEEFEDPVEDVHTSTLLAHEYKGMIIYVDGIMKEPLDMVDEHIDTFIHTRRRRWDLGHLIFYRDPI